MVQQTILNHWKAFLSDHTKEFRTLSYNPYFQTRYENVRCLPLAKFPYLIHYIVEEQSRRIVVVGLICTHRNPKIWRRKNK